MSQRPYPIVEYAHKLKKSTAEFTTTDLVAFTKWWIKQPDREDLLAMSKKYKDAQTNRLAGKLSSELEAQEEFEADLNVEEAANEVVCEMGLSQLDVDALKWGLGVLFADYALEGTEFEAPLSGLKESLEGL